MKIFENKFVKIGIVVLGGISLIIIILSLIFNGNDNTTDDEASLINAAKRYFENNSSMLPKEDYGTYTVAQNTLVSQNYIEQPKDSNGNNISCSSYVTVVKTPSGYVYNPYIHCGNESDTNLFYKNLIDKVVTSGDGLYQIKEEYYFKGDNPNNYVSFADKIWRVTKVTENKNIKMVVSFDNLKISVWDNRYNTETKGNTGINDYSISRIKTSLNELFNSNTYFEDSDKSKMAFTDICVGKRALNDKTADGSVECSSILQNQPISLLQLNEYFIASNDSNCPANNFASCQNYNFLAKKNFWTITAVSDNSYQSYLVYPSQGIKVQNTSLSSNILPAIVLKNDIGISGGTGTESDPYIIKKTFLFFLFLILYLQLFLYLL